VSLKSCGKSEGTRTRKVSRLVLVAEPYRLAPEVGGAYKLLITAQHALARGRTPPADSTDLHIAWMGPQVLNPDRLPTRKQRCHYDVIGESRYSGQFSHYLLGPGTEEREVHVPVQSYVASLHNDLQSVNHDRHVFPDGSCGGAR
jgi:hypothetical protein